MECFATGMITRAAAEKHGIDCTKRTDGEGVMWDKNRCAFNEDSKKPASGEWDASLCGYRCVDPKEGYMFMIETDMGSEATLQCITDKCIGGIPAIREDQGYTHEEPSYCEAGHTGPLCTEFIDGLGTDGGNACQLCPDTNVNVALYAGSTVGGVIWMIIMVLSTLKSAVKTDNASDGNYTLVLKIFSSYMQFNSLAYRIPYQYPSFVRDLLAAQEAPVKMGKALMSMDCIMETTGYGDDMFSYVYIETLITASYPILLGLLAGVLLVPGCVTNYLCCCCCKSEHEVDSMPMAQRRALRGQDVPEGSNEYRRRRSWNWYITSLQVMMFMLHPQLVEEAMGLFNCKTLGPEQFEGTDFLMRDMEQKCWDGWDSTHVIFAMGLGVPMMIFYVFGFPAVAGFMMFRHRDEFLKGADEMDQDLLKQYSFLFEGYEAEWYFWEVTVIMRKIAIVAIAVFCTDVHMQSLLAILLCVICLALQMYACPYEDDTMDILDNFGMFASFVTYFMGQFLFVKSLDATSRIIISMIIVVINCFAMGLFSLVFVYELAKVYLCCCKKDEDEGDEVEDLKKIGPAIGDINYGVQIQQQAMPSGKQLPVAFPSPQPQPNGLRPNIGPMMAAPMAAPRLNQEPTLGTAPVQSNNGPMMAPPVMGAPQMNGVMMAPPMAAPQLQQQQPSQ